MPSSPAEPAPRARTVKVTRRELVVALRDGRTLTVPLRWFPLLARATAAQRRGVRLIGRGEGLSWPLLDEDLSVAGLLRGTRPARRRPAPRRRRR